jgi:hypothetical protein
MPSPKMLTKGKGKKKFIYIMEMKILYFAVACEGK